MKATGQNAKKTKTKTRSGNLLVEVDSRKLAENIFKMKTFHMTKGKAYPYNRLNTSKEVIRSKEFALAAAYEMTAAQGKQGVTNIPLLLMCFKCKNMDTTGKIAEDNRYVQSDLDTDHTEEGCSKKINGPNCQQDHLIYFRSCDIHKKKKKILEVKHKRKMTFS